MSDTSEAVVVIGGGCLASIFCISWMLVLPTVGLLYMLGYLR